MRRALALLLLLAVPAEAGAEAGAGAPATALTDRADLLALGERIYRDGRLADGTPVQALVAGDVSLSGDQFSCVSCHQRSGLGTSEGWIVSPPVTESALYAPRTSGQRPRPAYDDASLARALREGVDPGGRRLEAPMPRYELPEREMAALIAYMKQLSRESPPGVTENEIHFATVTYEGADDRTMRSVLETFFRDKNGGTRHEKRRKLHGPWYRKQFNQPYRRWILHVWRLEGPPESWTDQLEAYFAHQPVFTLVSGMTNGPWGPVAAFCERHRLPALLPNTDLPPESPQGYYGRYFTAGPELEAAVLARLAGGPGGEGKLLVLAEDSPFARRAADALARSGLEVTEAMLSQVPDRLRRRPSRPAAVVAWVGRAQADGLLALAGRYPAVRFYVSATTAGDPLAGRASPAPENVFILSRSTPEPEFSRRYQRVDAWAKARGIEVTDRKIAAQTYFAAMTLGEALMHVKFDNYYRDYLIELVDHMTEITRYSVAHSRPSFGPGQPYISKGCYLTHQRDGKRITEWIVP